MIRKILTAATALALTGACAQTAGTGIVSAPPPAEAGAPATYPAIAPAVPTAAMTSPAEAIEVAAAAPPRITDPIKATMLRENSGITLQWIGWDERGQADITIADNGAWLLTASQQDPQTGGSVEMEGVIEAVGSSYFIFRGRITISGAPDADRFCEQDKPWRFEITQNRQYWRLREFEWCDQLTDYIDIYF